MTHAGLRRAHPQSTRRAIGWSLFGDAVSSDLQQPGPAERLYNASAHSWVRTEPTSLSDFTARPALLQLCLPLAQTHALDLGCGEGYCSRMLKRAGAKAVLGIDSSAAMIEAARAQELRDPLGLGFQ